MGRTAGGVLGIAAVAAIAGAGWLAMRPLRNRETLTLVVNRGLRDPSSDAMVSGMRFALAEAGNRAGMFRIELMEARHSFPAHARVCINLGSAPLIETGIEEPGTGVTLDSADPPLPLRPVADAREVGLAAGRWASETGSRTPVLLRNRNHPVSFIIARAFQEGAAPERPPLDEELEEGASDYPARLKTLVEQTIAAHPDLVFYSGEEAPYGRAFEMFDALRKGGFAGRLAMGDSDPEVSFLAIPTPVVEGTFLVSPIGPPSPGFAAAYEPATGRRAGPHAWPGYVAMNELLRVLDQATSGNRAHLAGLFNHAVRPPHPPALYQFKEGRFVFVRELK